MTKEEILKGEGCYHDDFSDWIACYDVAVFSAMQEYADQQTASLQAELTRLKEENSMLINEITRLNGEYNEDDIEI